MDVAVLVVDGVADFGLAAILEVFGTANALRSELEAPPPPWRLITIGVSEQVRSGAGHLVPVTPLDRLPARPELLVVPASDAKDAAGLLATVRSLRHAPALRMIATSRERGTRLAAACTGTFFLAEAGALDGCRATTSWWLGPAFRQRYPRVHLDESQILCHAEGVTTAGAALAHLDLALALVQAQSPALAELVARYLLIGNRASQAGFAIPGVLARADPAMAVFERWVRGHLHEPVSIAAAARAVGLSERNLQRVSATTLSMSPLEFVTEIRIDHATHLLRTTDLSTDQVARRVGYLNASTLRDLVRRRRGVTLRELRAGLVPTPTERPARRGLPAEPWLSVAPHRPAG